MSIGFRVVLSLVFVVLISGALPAQAQTSLWGDLAVSTGRMDFDLNGTGNAVGVAVRTKRHLSPHLALEVGGFYTRYCGDQFLGECVPNQPFDTTSLFMPEAQLQYRWNLGRVSPYAGGGMGVARLSALGMSVWQPTFSTAAGVAVYLTDQLGVTGDFRVRGHGRNFSGATSEITAGLVWRFGTF
jgi:Outer membrane protein beta-barrel domain